MRYTILSTPFRKQYLLLLLAGLLLSGCKKFLELPPPVNELVSDVVFDNDASATAAVIGIYADMANSTVPNQFTESGISLYAGMCADEIKFYSPGVKQEFVNNQITEINHAYISSNFWDRAYKFIYTANLCMEGLTRSTKVSSNVKTMLMGECKFIRAFCFFHLVNLFGDVPLTVVSDYKVTSELPRAPVADVYQRIITDLTEAREALGDGYPSTGKVRPNKATVNALLARVYLYQHDWPNAEALATAVIESVNPLYSLLADLSTVFLKNSDEAIWQLLPTSPVNNTAEGNLVLPGTPTSTPTYLLTDSLVNAFEPNDLRKTNWVATRTFQGLPYSYPYKYKIKTGTTITEYYMVFRLAEQYLVRAEARVKQNKLELAAADINMIRTRAGLPNTTAVTPAALLSAIEQERRVELFAEWGNRWYDLKRGDFNHMDSIMKLKPVVNWQPTDVLWPIPISQLRANPRLTQNPGY